MTDAESVLARAKAEGRARLRVYIGAAAGVGKTYQMLEDAHELKRQGMDVVVGSSRPTAARTRSRRSATSSRCRCGTWNTAP